MAFWTGSLTINNNTNYPIKWIEYNKGFKTKTIIMTIEPGQQNATHITKDTIMSSKEVKNKLRFIDDKGNIYMTSLIAYGPYAGMVCDRGDLPIRSQDIKLTGECNGQFWSQDNNLNSKETVVWKPRHEKLVDYDVTITFDRI